MSDTQRIPELLAPAGTMEAFKCALAAGADAIYCGIGSMNARRNATNLTLEEFGQACRMAHLAGTRVYVPTNIIIREDEICGALKTIRELWLAGADAFIVQDWGLLGHIHELWPDMELHLSTQANVHDVQGVRMAREAGCSRVTLSREMTLPEIEACSHEGVELEVFGHGALCVCYSGCCLMSSMQRGRSANRGLCRQPCRLPYRMEDADGKRLDHVGGEHLLSPADACTIDDLQAMADAGVSALKVEGRMKSPDYVATVTGAYRRALDELARGEDPRADAAVMRALSRSFNRTFTDDYLHGRSGNDMMSYERGNNRGQLVGQLVSSKGKLVRGTTTDPIGEGDLIEVRNPEVFDDYVTVKAPRDIEAGSEFDLTLSRPMGTGSVLRVIRSEAGMSAAREYAARTWPRKRPIMVRVRARLGQPFTIELAVRPGDAHPQMGAMPAPVRVEGFTVEAARTREVTEQDLIDHVGRLGTSPFEAVGWDIELDPGVGMPMGAVHALRARAVEELMAALLAPWEGRDHDLLPAPQHIRHPKYRRPKTPDDADKAMAPEVIALVTSPQMARAALAAGADRVMAEGLDLAWGTGSSGRRDLAGVTDEDPSSVGDWPEGTIILLPETSRDRDRVAMAGLIGPGVEIAAGTMGWMSDAVDAGATTWCWETIPAHNAQCADFMVRRGCAGVWLYPELELLEIENLVGSLGSPTGIMVAGHLRTMTTEHCLLQSQGPCAKKCATCARRAVATRVLDEFDRPALVTSSALGRSCVWEAQALDLTPQVPQLLRAGIDRMLVDCRLWDVNRATTWVKRVRKAIDDALAGRQPAPRLAGTTTGHLFERVG